MEMASINFHRPSCTFATTQSLLRAHPHPPQGWNSSPLGLISKICACPGQQKVSHELFAVPTNREQSSSANDSKPQGAAAANHPASHAASPSPPTTSSATPESVSSFKALPPPLSPEVLVSEALSGQLLSNAKRVFPKVAWGPTQLVQVMAWSTALAVVSVTAAATTPQASVLLASDELRSAAVRHLGLETLCCCLTIAVLYMGLRRSKPRSAGLFRYDVSPQLAMTVVALAAVSYPLADPVLYGIWSGVEQAFGLSNQLPDPGVTLVTQLRDASAGGDGVSIAMHVVASCIVGPFWEETFWRGFFLASLTRVLPPWSCVAISSTVFAGLHLGPGNILPIGALSAICDVLYLRTCTLAAPLILHAGWNAYQLAGILLANKDSFV